MLLLLWHHLWDEQKIAPESSITIASFPPHTRFVISLSRLSFTLTKYFIASLCYGKHEQRDPWRKNCTDMKLSILKLRHEKPIDSSLAPTKQRAELLPFLCWLHNFLCHLMSWIFLPLWGRDIISYRFVFFFVRVTSPLMCHIGAHLSSAAEKCESNFFFFFLLPAIQDFSVKVFFLPRHSVSVLSELINFSIEEIWDKGEEGRAGGDRSCYWWESESEEQRVLNYRWRYRFSLSLRPLAHS